MKKYFITATGTDIGKTLVTCALSHQLLAQGKSVRAIKPVISGFDALKPQQSDTGLLIAAQKLPLTQNTLDEISPWRFTQPLSPDMAAQHEGKTIDFDRLIGFCRKQSQADYVFVEGVGGVMVPLTPRHTVLEWMAELGFPVILVIGSYLGTLSHTLTAARVLLTAGLNLHAVVISQSQHSATLISHTEATLRRFLPATVRFISIPRLDSYGEIWKDVPDITQALFS